MHPTLSKEKAAEYVERLAKTRLLVIGDVMLDRYFWGSVDRISPEAPVPVVRVVRRSSRLGGAANVAANLRALGAEVELVGVVGDDSGGEETKRMISDSGIGADDLVSIPGRQTTEKVRIIAQSQQVVRADFEQSTPIPDDVLERFAKVLDRGSRKAGALIVSDYGKGVVEENSLRSAVETWRSLGKPVLVDPFVGHFHWYRRASLITPNAKEARSFYGSSLNGEQSLEKIGFKIREALELDALLITRGEEGMSLFSSPDDHIHIPTVAKEVYDVTGAGDTVISVIGAALAAGIALEDGVVLANQAAGEVVKEIGTSTVTGDSLIRSIF
jgi:D-beta-D-heptose 7-phosphate kinase/D-beta-D-heptose 1-phosphate adenosyltransferase